MDALDQAISAKRDEIARLRASLDVLSAELAALEYAATLRPATTSRGGRAAVSPAETPRKSAGGRRPGDISLQWRKILGEVYRRGIPLDYDAISDVARSQGKEIGLASIRDRIRNLANSGLVDGDPSAGFIVTEMAAQRFGFTKNNAPPEGEALSGAVTPVAEAVWD